MPDRKRKMMCSVRAEVKFAVWQRRVTIRKCMALVSFQ
jgi:hypothetical protein